MKAPASNKIAALYARVSTGRQAEKDLSIPDQLRQLKEYAAANETSVAVEYVEPGASARDDRRPAFQDMVSVALSKNPPFNVILVLTTSRFFRDATKARLYKHKLRRKGIQVIATTQETSDDPSGHLVEGFFELVDQYESEMTGFHTARAMKENVRRGYLNHPPRFGFKAELMVDDRGNQKKRPVVNETEAQVVQQIFDLALSGLGTLQIARRLRQEGLTQRSGKAWSKQRVLEVLRDPAYKGEYATYRKDWKTGRVRPKSEWMVIEVPPIVSPEKWERVDRFLTSRSPAVINPAIVGRGLLLTGLLKCGKCGAAMTLETGKGGKYRYYNCRRRLRVGKETCEGSRIRVEHLEHSLLTHIQYELFTPDRVRLMLKELSKSLADAADDAAVQRRALVAERKGLEKRLTNQYKAIESGAVDLADVGDRIRELKARMLEIEVKESSLTRQTEVAPIPTDDKTIDRVTANLEKLLLSNDREFTRRYLRLLVEKVVVDGKVVHVHLKDQGVADLAAPESTKGTSELTEVPLVPSSEGTELLLTDSNRRPSG